MMSKNEPMESLFNSIHAVKDALLPLELQIRKAARDLESCWGVVPKNRDDRRNDHELAADLNCADNRNRKRSRGQICSAARKKSACNGVIDNGCHVVGEESKKGFSIKVPVKTLFGMFSRNSENERQGSGYNKVEESNKGLKEKGMGSEGMSCVNCLQFAVTWSLLVSGFIQAFPAPWKTGKNRSQKVSSDEKGYFYLCKQGSRPKVLGEPKKSKLKDHYAQEFENGGMNVKKCQLVSLEYFTGLLFDHVSNTLQKFDQSWQQSERLTCDADRSTPPQASAHFDYLKVMMHVWEGRKVDVNGFLGNLSFARVGDVPSSLVGVSSSVSEEGGHNDSAGSCVEKGGSSPKKVASQILSIPLSNVERLRSTLSTVSLTELIELMPPLGRSSKDHPDKRKLFSVQDFFRYTESEGRRFFEELDRDGDGQVTLEDLEIAMKRRKLPQKYAREFMQRAKSHLFSKSFGWKQFLSLMEQREPTILRAYTSLCLSKSGTLQKSEILASLKNAGLPANEDNAIAMMRFLNADTGESISYGHFQNFMLLLPSDRLQDDPRNIWFEAATVVAVAPPMEIPAGSVLRSALAGGLSSALSCALMHPVDTIKTRVQASARTFPEIISKLPDIGGKGLYRGSIPAIWGQFTSHGLRTGILEACKLVLINVAPALPEIQVQSMSSFFSTFLGTAVRIPCEVLKQRLQAGIFDNIGEAIIGTWHQDGLKGLFRGTAATLFREVPFYVAGMCLYAESKKAAEQLLRRELEPWETISVGALSGGLAAVVTTPFDVMKTRMMTARGRSLPMSIVAFTILRHEGALGLFKGAIPRFFWIAPLGAMNFAGYELARKALNKSEQQRSDQPSQKKLTSSV